MHTPSLRQNTLRFLTVILAGIPYFAWFGGVVGLRPEHFFQFSILAFLYLANAHTRHFLASFSAFALLWVVYDSMRVFPNYSFHPVHISEPYLFDKQWFGINTATGRQTLNEYFAAHTSTGLDIITALFYLTWIPVPMAFAAWLWFRYRPLFIRFSYGYLMTNLIGFSIYYLYPAAPPWYVELNGFVFHTDTLRSSAGLEKFDQLIGFPLFERIYQRNSNVFAAIPSMHSAYPLITWFYARQVRERWPAILFATLSIGIWLSAIYLRHHYIIDVLLGILTAITGYFSFEALYKYTAVGRWIDRLQGNRPA
jgi:membrane-associated phospholipid phosphatase